MKICLFLLMPLYWVLFGSCGNLPRQAHQSLDKARLFLDKQNFRYDYVYLYSYLQKNKPNTLKVLKHQALILDFTDSLSKAIQNAPDERLPAALTYARLARQDWAFREDFLKNLPEEGADAIVLPALYCDQKPLPENYIKTLQQESLGGDYRTSHCLLALLFLKEQGCWSLELKKMANHIFKLNQNFVKKNNIINDLYIETLALLQANGKRVPRKHLLALLDLQAEDGGWSLETEKSESHSHSTILAIWALLPVASKRTGK